MANLIPLLELDEKSVGTRIYFIFFDIYVLNEVGYRSRFSGVDKINYM
jgi:hypothetical protein